MYFKKQLIFSVFIVVILAILFYKQKQTNRDSTNSKSVLIQVSDKVCSYRLVKNNSYIKFNFQNKEYQISVNKDKCKEISVYNPIELYYSAGSDTFYFEELFEPNYFKEMKTFLICLLILGLIPYKLLINSLK